MNRCILFVDDEQAVLNAISRLLRSSFRGEWDVVTALGGQAALEVVSARTTDVVVADMRMPGLSGLALLERVRELQPDALRIVLSGQVDLSDSELRAAMAVAHYRLGKPCTARELLDVIQQSGRAPPAKS